MTNLQAFVSHLGGASATQRNTRAASGSGGLREEGIDASLRWVRIGSLNAHGQRVDDNAALPQLLFQHRWPPDRPLATRQTRAPPTIAAAVSTGQMSSSNTRCIKGLSAVV